MAPEVRRNNINKRLKENNILMQTTSHSAQYNNLQTNKFNLIFSECYNAQLATTQLQEKQSNLQQLVDFSTKKEMSMVPEV